ncbi:hypothetical protein ACO0K9_18135 [Undibacterium sp. Ji50W]|uniref:hypothetical protein n=1 Tax=Undibacterium sp. Ji50W TaxID=3413041 RepID=UPI003BF056E9
MKLLERVQTSIDHSSSPIVLRSELSSLGSASQLSKSLKTLISNGHLIRIGSGMYAKSRQDSQGIPQLLDTIEKIVEAAFKKLGIKAKVIRIESNGAQQICHVNTEQRSISRKLNIAPYILKYTNTSHHAKNASPTSMPKELDKLPTTGVSEFVQRFANAHNVAYARSGLDDWAEAVTQASGDSVQLDQISKLLITLKKQHLIDGQQLARLITNHLKETANV